MLTTLITEGKGVKKKREKKVDNKKKGRGRAGGK